MPTTFHRNNRLGISSVIGATFFFSFTDMAIKFLSGDYALHQIVLIRSLIGIIILLAAIVPLEGGFGILRTKRLSMHLLRSSCVVLANMTLFLALAAMPLVNTVAIFFVAPMLITVFSVIFLGETVGPHRWFAVGMGFTGVIVMMRPGSDSFQLAAFLPLASAAFYASIHILTRKIGHTEVASTLTFYTQLTYICVGVFMGLTVGDGQFNGVDDPSVEFLLRAWNWPSPEDYWIFILKGLSSTFGGYLISQAYRKCEAGLAAPFEYLTLVLAIFWGLVVFGEWPDKVAWLGIALIIGSGLFMFWREAVNNARKTKIRAGRF